MIKRFNRYPLIIDPSGQATDFILNEYKDRKITKTRCVGVVKGCGLEVVKFVAFSSNFCRLELFCFVFLSNLSNKIIL